MTNLHDNLIEIDDEFGNNDPKSHFLDKTIRLWQYRLKRLDRLADYLVICKGNDYGDKKTVYDNFGLQRLYYNEDRKYNEANFSYLINYNLLNIETMLDVIENISMKNGYLGSEKCIGEVYEKNNDEKELMAKFKNPTEKRIAALLISGYNKKEIKEMLNISQHILQKNLDKILLCLKSTEEAQADEATEQKLCKKCVTEKPITDFAKDKRNKSGYTSTCKACDLKRHTKKIR